MSNPIFTFGYGYRDPRHLILAARHLDALVVDIRMSPRSRMAGWDRHALADMLGPRYIHLPQLGNVNFGTDGVIQLKEPAVGIPAVLRMATTRTLILMCGCVDAAKCHRTEVAGILRGAGAEVRELPWEGQPWAELPVLDWEPIATQALTIHQPWAWLICHGFKDVENRTWPTRVRGPIFVHAGKTLDMEAWESLCRTRRDIVAQMPRPHDLDRGGIVGVMEISDCVNSHASSWYTGEWAFVLQNARPLNFMPLRGAQGFFAVQKQLAAAENKPEPQTPASRPAKPARNDSDVYRAAEPVEADSQPSLFGGGF